MTADFHVLISMRCDCAVLHGHIRSAGFAHVGVLTSKSRRSCENGKRTWYCFFQDPDQPFAIMQASKRCAGGIVESIHHFDFA